MLVGEKKKYKFKLVAIKEGTWIILYCPDKMDFYNYHNLMSWILGREGERSIGQIKLYVWL